MLTQEEILNFDIIFTLSYSEQQKWKETMDEEIEYMTENDMCDLEELPMDTNAIACKWVLWKKKDIKYKARLLL